MISTFRARNFRAFEEIELKGLRRLNVVVGASAAGKTALLEGIRLALGATPQIGYTLPASRGTPLFFMPNATQSVFEAAWSSLFFDFDLKRHVKLGITDSSHHKASVEIYFDLDQSVTLSLQQPPAGMPGAQAFPATITPVAFERHHFDGEKSTLLATINQQGHLQLEQGPEIGPSSELLYSSWQLNPGQIANWYSQLSINNQEKEIVEAVKREFGDVTDVSVAAPQGVAMLYATVKHRSRKMPLSLISSGLNKFTSLLIAIRNYSPGVVLMDEIENGIYYKMFPALWHALHSFAGNSDTQLFLSTHSWECLRAAAPLIERFADDFAIIQVYQEKGRSQALVVPGDDAAAAISGDIEIRT